MNGLAQGVLDNLGLIEARLKAESEGYGDEIDRLRAEGEFRLGLVDPALALIAATAIAAWSVLPVIALVVPISLYRDGRAKASQATASALAALRSDALDPIPSVVTQLREEASEIPVPTENDLLSAATAPTR